MQSTCGKCNATLKQGASYCGQCGAKAAGDEVSTSDKQTYAAAAPAAENEAYIGNRLVYDEVQTYLDDGVTLSRVMQTLTVPAVAGMAAFVFVFLYEIIQNGVLSGTVSGFLYGIFYGGLVFICAVSSAHADSPLNEWSFLLDDKAPLAEGAFEHVARILHETRERGRPPMQRVRLPNGTTGNYLVVREGRHVVAYISIYQYGTGLFLGWVMWRRQNGWGLVFTYIRQVFTNSAAVERLLVANDIRALRECVHNAVREGAEAAQRASAPLPTGTFGSIPIQNSLKLSRN